MKTQKTLLPLPRLIALAASFLLAAFVAGCGGGGAGGQGTTGSTGGSSGGPSSAAAMSLTTSTPTIGSDGRTVATIAAVIKDSANRTLANQQVSFSTTDLGTSLQIVNNRTDASGTSSALLSIKDPSNRLITVVAESGSLRQEVQVAVIGTTLTLNGPANLVSNSPTDYTASLRDSAGGIIAGKPVAIVSSAGNTLSAATLNTDSAGQAKFQLTGTKSGADKISVSALGASAALDVQVSTTQLTFSAPSSGQEVPVTSSQTVTVSYVLGGVAQSGQLISFQSTRGTLSAASATTDNAGKASVSIQSATAGISTITASVASGANAGVVATQRIEFVSKVPGKIVLQASPPSVGVNLVSGGGNSSQLIAVVRDLADNPVKGATVNFSALVDPSNGRIEPPFATTDSSGVASVAFYPGANSTGNNAILAQAAVNGSTLTATTTLTASKQELVVRIGTGNKVEELSLTANGMPWSAVVTDANGNPIEAAAIQASLVSTRYLKGRYFWNGIVWVPHGTTASLPPYVCSGEDLNGNGRLDAGEDNNSNGRLDPGSVAAVEVTSTSARTDATGLATMRINYPKDFGSWAEVRLRVTITTIAGTEGTDERTFVLPVLSGDASDEKVAPPGAISPFGLQADCKTTQ
ncbi:MAG: Ig-like domain-containing protein [Burkholderiaceae bacterium]